MRFRGRAGTLNAMCGVFLEHPGVGLTPNEIASYGSLGFRDVHQRLQDTPELFIRLPKQPDRNVRYRLASSLASRSPEEIAEFIAEQTRIETRIARIVISAFVLIFLTALTLSIEG
jgi:hypothetical protein